MFTLECYSWEVRYNWTTADTCCPPWETRVNQAWCINTAKYGKHPIAEAPSPPSSQTPNVAGPGSRNGRQAGAWEEELDKLHKPSFASTDLKRSFNQLGGVRWKTGSSRDRCGITEPSGKEQGFPWHAQLLEEICRQDDLRTEYVSNKAQMSKNIPQETKQRRARHSTTQVQTPSEKPSPQTLFTFYYTNTKIHQSYKRQHRSRNGCLRNTAGGKQLVHQKRSNT